MDEPTQQGRPRPSRKGRVCGGSGDLRSRRYFSGFRRYSARGKQGRQPQRPAEREPGFKSREGQAGFHQGSVQGLRVCRMHRNQPGRGGSELLRAHQSVPSCRGCRREAGCRQTTSVREGQGLGFGPDLWCQKSVRQEAIRGLLQWQFGREGK